MTYNEKINECLAAIKNGDQTKFDDLLHLTYGPLKNVAKGYLLDKSYAADVVSEMYYRLCRYSDRYNTSKDAFAYLWQIVKHISFDCNKRQLKECTVNIDEIQIFDKLNLYENADVRMDIIKALKRVGHTNAMIVVWTYRDRLTQEEIGEKLGISKSAVCQRLSKTMKKLSQYLK